MITSPIRFLADTPNMQTSMQRVANQFRIDGYKVERVETRGGGRFLIETDSEIFIYQWSAKDGTRIHLEF